MLTPLFSSFWNWKEKEYRFDIFKSTSFDSLTNVRQAYGIVLNKETTHVIVVHNKIGIWLLPGGKVEPNETLEQTLIREVKEETNRELDIKTITPAFYQIANEKVGEAWKELHSEVRYLAVIENDIPFISDPDNGDITEAKWVPIEELPTYVQWGKTSELIVELAKNFNPKATS